jgi:hypothetical protein
MNLIIIEHEEGMMDEKMPGNVTRRKFLSGAGVSVAGFAVAGTMGMLLGKSVTHDAEASVKLATPQPLRYVKLDPDIAAELTYKGYDKGG